MFQRSLAVLLLLTSSALAEPAKPAADVVIEGRFGFDVLKPKQKCAKVSGALHKKLSTSYRCVAPDNGGETGSGVISTATCTLKKGRGSEYMLFTTADDCNKERETQLANAE